MSGRIFLAALICLCAGRMGVNAQVPAQSIAAWQSYPGNPVLGGEYGTYFDVSVLKDNGIYRMWVSWRPKGSVALVESRDGLHWSGPPTIVLGPRREIAWENDINRPVVIKREDGYHMWYFRPVWRALAHRLCRQPGRGELETHG